MKLSKCNKSLLIAAVAVISALSYTYAMNMKDHKTMDHDNMEMRDHKSMDHKPMEMMGDTKISKYSDKEFTEALASGEMVVLDFYKDGCPVCAKQHPILEKAANDYANAKFFRVNFKTEISTVSKFKVGSQSTIIVFNDGEEVNRSVGQTKESKLTAQFASAKAE